MSGGGVQEGEIGGRAWRLGAQVERKSRLRRHAIARQVRGEDLVARTGKHDYNKPYVTLPGSERVMSPCTCQTPVTKTRNRVEAR